MKKNKYMIIGGIIGGVWGITNFFISPTLTKKNVLLGNLFSIPIRISGRLSENLLNFHIDSLWTIFLVPLLIGVVIGSLMGAIFGRYKNS